MVAKVRGRVSGEWAMEGHHVGGEARQEEARRGREGGRDKSGFRCNGLAEGIFDESKGTMAVIPRLNYPPCS